MDRREIKWRYAAWVGALVSAMVWSILLVLVLAEVGDSGRAFPAGVWTPAIAASVSLLGLGAILTWRGRSTVARSWGVALLVSALIGWLALASSYWIGTAMMRWG